MLITYRRVIIRMLCYSVRRRRPELACRRSRTVDAVKEYPVAHRHSGRHRKPHFGGRRWRHQTTGRPVQRRSVLGGDERVGRDGRRSRPSLAYQARNRSTSPKPDQIPSLSVLHPRLYGRRPLRRVLIRMCNYLPSLMTPACQ